MTGAAIIAGFYGKLPSRGDFVTLQLPAAFTRPWDAWLADRLGGSQSSLGAGWVAAWLEAPVWRFALAPGLAGPEAVLGVMLPSVDRAGRYFPMSFAALFPAGAARQAGGDADWLDRCEAAGRAALEQDIAPDALPGLMGAAPIAAPDLADGAAFWTEGGPRVEPGHRRFATLPGAEAFLAMIAGTAAEAL
ncbi:MAG: type VI secretion system-associated protein TagF [Acetobacteraceae bacterium]